MILKVHLIIALLPTLLAAGLFLLLVTLLDFDFCLH